ncbi:unnamed protein product [Phyllotreta striolata]|uniref:Ribosomal protein S6 kinase delta-1 n=1 Tax=Phyllotreta striolata TaxID=444603 RepID=A0A9N9TVN1_PHYSR|nr:unnamed protein product [Phyllotreta striolata]
MVSIHDKWMRIFDIPDTRKHKSGFTIYKVVSLLYPETCPDAVTKVTVWKRYNDFRRLHKELKLLYKKITNNKDFPNLPAKTIIKRFDKEIIEERKQSILLLLDFIGCHYQLFTSKEFIKFLETSHTPSEHLTSNITSIRAELHLPEDPEVCAALSDDDITISDSDSICTLSTQLPVDVLSDTKTQTIRPARLSKFNSTASLNSHTSSNNSDLSNITNIFDSISLLDGQSYSIPFIRSLDDNVQYILDASVHVNLAGELEEGKKYEEAYVAYNAAVDILTKHGNDDPVYERKQLVRYKVNKYRLRAEKIYNMYLSPEIKEIELITKPSEEDVSKRPLFDLYKFNVVKIINSVILVLHTELQKLFYMKIVHKPVDFKLHDLLLPNRVPYMVKLENHYDCENALFLLLEYSNGSKISEYLLRDDKSTIEEDFPTNRLPPDDSDNESEASFSELINDYNNSRSGGASCDKSFEDFETADVADEAAFTEHHFRQKYTRRRSENARKLSEISSNFDVEAFANKMVVRETLVVKWAAQLLVALEKLHDIGVVCRDLQMKNIMIDDNEDVVLTYMYDKRDSSDLFSSKLNHNLAPEVYGFQEITESADWYSYGAILYELLVGIPLSEVHTNGISICKSVKVPGHVSPEGRSLLKQLLVYEPQERLGWGPNGTENLKSHPFFKSIHWESLDPK